MKLYGKQLLAVFPEQTTAFLIRLCTNCMCLFYMFLFLCVAYCFLSLALYAILIVFGVVYVLSSKKIIMNLNPSTKSV